MPPPTARFVSPPSRSIPAPPPLLLFPLRTLALLLRLLPFVVGVREGGPGFQVVAKVV